MCNRPIGIQILCFLRGVMIFPQPSDTKVKLSEKILNFLSSRWEKNIRDILQIPQTVPFNLDDWIITMRQNIERYNARQVRSE